MGESKAPREAQYHGFDAMTTAELEGLLRADLHCPGEDALDADAILYILDLLEQRQGNPSRREETAREKLGEFRALYLPDHDPASLYDWGEDQAEQPAQTPRRTPKLRVIRRLGLVAAAIAVLFATLLAAQAAGVDLWGVIVRWSDETFHFTYQGDGPSSSWMDGREELEGLALKEELPRWIPEGYTVDKVQESSLTGWSHIYLTFSSADAPAFDMLITCYRDLEAMQATTFEKDAVPMEEKQLSNGETVYFYQNGGHEKSVYQHENMIYTISGEISDETAMKIYASTQEEG